MFLCETSQSREPIYFMSLFIWHSGKDKTTEIVKRPVSFADHLNYANWIDLTLYTPSSMISITPWYSICVRSALLESNWLYWSRQQVQLSHNTINWVCFVHFFFAYFVVFAFGDATLNYVSQFQANSITREFTVLKKISLS